MLHLIRGGALRVWGGGGGGGWGGIRHLLWWLFFNIYLIDIFTTYWHFTLRGTIGLRPFILQIQKKRSMDMKCGFCNLGEEASICGSLHCDKDDNKMIAAHHKCMVWLFLPGRVAQSVGHLTRRSGPGFDTWSGNILWFPLLLFQEGQLSVTVKSMCTKYWLTA